jgi:hypothetical protein
LNESPLDDEIPASNLLLPSQFYAEQVHVYHAHDFLGQVYCLQRTSHIATARCAEYQEKFNCRCRNAATPAEIRFVKQNMRDAALGQPARKRKKRSTERFKVMSEASLINLLSQKLVENDRAVARAKADVDRLQPISESIRRVIAALGGSVDDTESRAEAKHRSVASRTLPRQPAFASLSATAAIKQILESSFEPVPRRTLADKIFAIEDSKDLERALGSLSSTLSAGVKRKFWKCLDDGYEIVKSGK